MKIKPYHLHFSFVLLLMISLHFCICGAALAKKSNSMISGECNATIAECIADERGGEEFLMESETTRRFLASPASPVKHIVLQTQGKGPVCKTRLYGNCIGQANNYKRPCDTYNRCKHNPNTN
ncbi:Protein RALF-like 33 [Camellia lanceoleosa]|uniref:Protein RALF-like 33 n=1 Tax=Camellia lanceoleosa TaxID=1840588 RepID=A0ACC0IW47_9ERIC|nr:Protein RALF-like 33 [Camellia lanceoleosa]